jgi:hypothetical protein
MLWFGAPSTSGGGWGEAVLWPGPRGAGVLVVSTEAEESTRLCSRCSVMVDGHLVGSLVASDITVDNIVRQYPRPWQRPGRRILSREGNEYGWERHGVLSSLHKTRA